jgi:HrpA-like RNA helicase
MVLQPRRVAARSLATRIAAERGWTIGNEVGWHVRFERRFGPATKVLFATEGILTARLQQDPLLGGFRTIILDEFHERSVHADLGIALAKQAWLARSDLRLVIMSATLDAAAVSTYLDDCPIVEVAGTSYPLDVRYAPGLSLADAVGTCLQVAGIGTSRPQPKESRSSSFTGRSTRRHRMRRSRQPRAGASSCRRTSRKRRSPFLASRRSSIPDSRRLPVTIPSAPSTASRPNGSRRTRRTSVRAGPRGSDRAWRSGCGTSAIA